MTWGQQAAEMIRQAEIHLADPSKAQFHDRLRVAIRNMQAQLDFWNTLAMLTPPPDDEW